MASIRRRGKGWQARVVRRGQGAVAKTFISKQDAEKWARSVEREMDQDAYLERSTIERTTIGDLLRRYREEVTPGKRGFEVEEVRLAAMERSALASLSLAAASAKAIAAYRDQRLTQVSPSTVILIEAPISAGLVGLATILSVL